MDRNINQVKWLVYFADRELIFMMLTKNEKNVIFQQDPLMILAITHREVAIFIIISRPVNSEGLSIWVNYLASYFCNLVGPYGQRVPREIWDLFCVAPQANLREQ